MRRHDLVVKTDTIVSGVHFLADEKARARGRQGAARLSLRSRGRRRDAVHLSALAVACRRAGRSAGSQASPAGLAADQRRYGIVLCGGDTVVSPGPLTVTITAFGRVPRGRGLDARRRAGGRSAVGERHDRRRRAGPAGRARSARRARPSRNVIGDRSRARRWARAWSALRRRRPTSPTACWPMPATSRDASRLGVVIERERVPLSAGARRALAADPRLWANVLGGGDDYELVIAVPPRKQSALLAAARAAGVQGDANRPLRARAGRATHASPVGRCGAPRKGYVHF